jgi:hypothetical protein
MLEDHLQLVHDDREGDCLGLEGECDIVPLFIELKKLPPLNIFLETITLLP